MRSLAFRVRRKRFAIEVFHLPPDEGIEEGDNEHSNQINTELSKMIIGSKDGSGEGGCSTGVSNVNKLDF